MSQYKQESEVPFLNGGRDADIPLIPMGPRLTRSEIERSQRRLRIAGRMSFFTNLCAFEASKNYNYLFPPEAEGNPLEAGRTQYNVPHLTPKNERKYIKRLRKT